MNPTPVNRLAVAATERAGHLERSGTTSQWWIVLAAFVGLTFGPSTLAVLSFGVFVKPLEAEFGWSRAQVTWGVAIISWMIVIVSPLQGYLLDRFGSRRIILPCIPAFAAGLAAFYYLPNQLWMFYVMCAALPLLGIGLWPPAYLKMVSNWFEQRLGLAIGIANAGIGVGAALIPVIAAALLQQYGWRVTYAVLGGIALVVTFPLALLLLREPHMAGESKLQQLARTGLNFAEALRTREFWLLIGGTFLLGVTGTGLVAHHVPMLIDTGLTPQQAAHAQVTFGIALIAGRLITGYLLDHFFAPHVVTAFVLSMVGACAIYAAGATGAQIFVAAALFGLLIGAEFDVLAYVIRRYFGMRTFGKIFGTLFALYQLGSGIGSSLLAWMRSLSDSYTVGLWTFAGITLASAFFFLRLGSYRYTLEGERVDR